MHESSYRRMADWVYRFLEPGRPTRVLDVGGLDLNGSYRPLFADPAWEYVACDIVPGPNVTVVLADPYTWTEFDPETFDVVISGQTFEHIEFPWLTMREVARVMRTGALAFLTAPAAGPEHRHPVDAWRIYPDGWRALAKWAGLFVLEADADWNPSVYTDGSEVWNDSWLLAKKLERFRG